MLRGDAGGAGADEIEAMVGDNEPVGGRHRRRQFVHTTFELRRGVNIEHRSAAVTDDVMMMTGEVLGELIASGVIGGNQSMYDAGFLKNGEIAIGRALGHAIAAFKEFAH